MLFAINKVTYRLRVRFQALYVKNWNSLRVINRFIFDTDCPKAKISACRLPRANFEEFATSVQPLTIMSILLWWHYAATHFHHADRKCWRLTSASSTIAAAFPGLTQAENHCDSVFCISWQDKLAKLMLCDRMHGRQYNTLAGNPRKRKRLLHNGLDII